MTTTPNHLEHITEDALASAVASAWGEGRQVDVTLTSNDVLRGTALIPRHSPREIALFGLRRPGLPVATAVLRVEEIAGITITDQPADDTLGSLLIGDERVDDPSWTYTTGDGAPAYGSALRASTTS